MKRLLALVAVALLVSTCSKSPEDAYQDLQNKAADQLASYEFDKAESTFIEILFEDTTRFDGPIGLARSAERQLMHWDALHLYMKLTARNPRLAEAALGTMRVATRLGLDKLSLDRAGTAMQLLGESDQGVAVVATARRILKTEQPNITYELADRAVEAGQPEAIGNLLRAHAFYREQKFDSSGTMLTRALEQGADGSLFPRLAADFYEMTGQFDSAMAFSLAAWDIDRTDFDVMVEHFYRALRLGYYNDARTVVQTVERDGPGTAPAYMLRLLFQWGVGQNYEAMNTNVLLMDHRPHTLTAHLTNVQTNARVSNFITSTAELQFVEGLLSRGNYLPAFRDFMNYRLAMINSYLDDQRIPLQQLQARAQNRTSEQEHRIREIYLLYRIGAVDEFEAKVDTIEEFYSTNVEWMTDVADVLADSTIKLYSRARETYETALALDPWYRPAYEGYLELWRLQENADSLQAVMRRFNHFAREFADLRVTNALYRARLGQSAAATDSFLAAIPPLQGSIPKWETMYATLARNQATDDMARLMAELRSTLPEDPDALVLVARELERTEQFERVLDLTEQLAREYPDHTDLRAHHAWALFKTGDEDGAFEEFEDLKASHEDNSELLHFFSRALAESQRDPARAQNEARRAVFSGPEVYRDFMNLAYVYMMTGRPDLARGEARRAMVAFPDRPEAYYYQGYALYLQNEDGAKELLQQALDRGLSGDDAQRARDALKEL